MSFITEPMTIIIPLLWLAGLAVLRIITSKRDILKPLSGVCDLLFIYVLGTFVRDLLPGTLLPGSGPYLEAVLLTILAWALIRLTVWVAFDLVVNRQKGVAVPGILKSLTTAILMIFAVVFILRNTLNINLASLIATSAVLSIILGLALQDTLANMFAGLSLQVEAPFSIGDWIAFEEHLGQVVAVDWRTVKIRTLENDHVIVPNSVIAKNVVTNHSRPSRSHVRRLHLGIHYRIPPNRAKEAIIKALEIDPDVTRRPPFEVRVVNYGDFSITYQLRFYITDFARHQVIQDRIMTRVWYYLRRADVPIPFPIRDVNLRTVTQESLAAEAAGRTWTIVETLKEVDFLHPLTDREVSALAEKVSLYTAFGGEIIIRQGDPGDSSFVIQSGEAEVSVDSPGGEKVITTLGPGDFFGEMSLATGAERSATVRAATDLEVIVISKKSFKHILDGNPDIAAAISPILARRQMELEKRSREATEEVEKEELDKHASNMVDSIRRFFRL